MVFQKADRVRLTGAVRLRANEADGLEFVLGQHDT